MMSHRLRRHHAGSDCIHCLMMPAAKFGLCIVCLATLRAAATAAQVAQLAAQRDPQAVACKSCEANACTLSDGLCPECRRAVA